MVCTGGENLTTAAHQELVSVGNNRMIYITCSRSRRSIFQLEKNETKQKGKPKKSPHRFVVLRQNTTLILSIKFLHSDSEYDLPWTKRPKSFPQNLSLQNLKVNTRWVRRKPIVGDGKGWKEYWVMIHPGSSGKSNCTQHRNDVCTPQRAAHGPK